jgi:hypothetical protein
MTLSSFLVYGGALFAVFGFVGVLVTFPIMRFCTRSALVRIAGWGVRVSSTFCSVGLLLLAISAITSPPGVGAPHYASIAVGVLFFVIFQCALSGIFLYARWKCLKTA